MLFHVPFISGFSDFLRFAPLVSQFCFTFLSFLDSSGIFELFPIVPPASQLLPLMFLSFPDFSGFSDFSDSESHNCSFSCSCHFRIFPIFPLQPSRLISQLPGVSRLLPAFSDPCHPSHNCAFSCSCHFRILFPDLSGRDLIHRALLGTLIISMTNTNVVKCTDSNMDVYNNIATIENTSGYD